MRRFLVSACVVAAFFPSKPMLAQSGAMIEGPTIAPALPPAGLFPNRVPGGQEMVVNPDGLPCVLGWCPEELPTAPARNDNGCGADFHLGEGIDWARCGLANGLGSTVLENNLNKPFVWKPFQPEAIPKLDQSNQFKFDVIDEMIRNQGPLQMPSPVCMIDPCACGYCPEGPVPQMVPGQNMPMNRDESGLGLRNLFTTYKPIATAVLNESSLSSGKDLVPKSLDRCQNPNQPPWSVSRERFLARKNLWTCSNAVQKLQDFESMFLSGARDLINGAFEDDKYVDKAFLDEAKETYFGYVDACLHSLPNVAHISDVYPSNEPGRSNVLRLGTADDQPDLLFASIGRIFDGPRDWGCSGALVEIAGKPSILTALHCVTHKPSTTGENGITTSGAFRKDLVFVNYLGEVFEIKTQVEMEAIHYDRETEDVVSLPVTGLDATRRFLPITKNAPATWEPLHIVGYNPYLEAKVFGADGRGEEVLPLEDLRNSTAISFSPYCYAGGLKQGGLRYLCQTARGMSGSPILVQRNGLLEVAGVHLSAVDENPRPLTCLAGKLDGGYNRGVAVAQP